MEAPTIYRSPFPSYHTPVNKSLHQFLLECNPDNVRPDKVILEELAAPNDRLTYGGIRDAAAVAAGGFTNKYNLKPGDAVAVLATNSVNYVVLAHSVMWFGGVIM